MDEKSAEMKNLSNGGLEGCMQDAYSTCLEAFCESEPLTVAISHM